MPLMADITYRRAVHEDIAALVEMRAAFLAEVADADPTDPLLTDALRRYFSSTIPSGEFVAFLAAVDRRIVATSGLVYHRQPPSAGNLLGVEAYIMNMYTLPAWRGRGIASVLLKKLVAEAQKSKIRRIRLHALARATPLYSRAGFISTEGEMKLDLA